VVQFVGRTDCLALGTRALVVPWTDTLPWVDSWRTDRVVAQKGVVRRIGAGTVRTAEAS
jgi:hypothetical protein